MAGRGWYVHGYLDDAVGEDWSWVCADFFFQAEDGIRDLVRSRGLGDVYKRQARDAGLHIAQGFGADTQLLKKLLRLDAMQFNQA